MFISFNISSEFPTLPMEKRGLSLDGFSDNILHKVAVFNLCCNTLSEGRYDNDLYTKTPFDFHFYKNSLLVDQSLGNRNSIINTVGSPFFWRKPDTTAVLLTTVVGTRFVRYNVSGKMDCGFTAISAFPVQEHCRKPLLHRSMELRLA